MTYHRLYDLPTSIVRIFNTYGPRLRPADGRVVSNFLVQAIDGKPLTMYGTGKQTRSFCYVEDEVRGIIALFDSGVADPVNIGNPNEITMLELADLMREVTGSSSDIVFEPLPVGDPTRRRPTSRGRVRCSGGNRRSSYAKGSRVCATGTWRSVRMAARDNTTPPSLQKLSVVVPVFNERNTLVEILRRMRAVELPDGIEKEIIVVDDGSNDGTRDVLKQLGDSTVRVVMHDVNQGKGAAVRTGLRHATGEYVLVQDADLEYDPEDWPKLLAAGAAGPGARGLRVALHR